MGLKNLVPLFLLLCVIQISFAAVAIEYAAVNDPILKAQGYTCYNKNIGLMKNGDVNTNYSQKTCGKVSCGGGVLNYEFCGAYQVEGQTNRPQDPTKPFPECCNYPF
nr:uncharacterized protein LOC111413584 [Onthophagus taurus]